MKELFFEAQKKISAGFWVVPTVGKISKTNNDKKNKLSFSTFCEIAERKGCNGLAILTNEESNYLSFDLDPKDATNPTLFSRRLLFELDNYPSLKAKIMLSKSPSGGFHLYAMFREKLDFVGAWGWSEYIEGEKQKQTITGRAVGNYCCEYPTPNYQWIIENELTELTDSEEKDLICIFQNLNEDKQREAREAKKKARQAAKRAEKEQKRQEKRGPQYRTLVTVWDDYAQNVDVRTVLERNNFSYVYTVGRNDYYLRHGSSAKHSGFVKPDNTYCNFSDNAGLPTAKNGSTGRVFNSYQLAVFLEYGGDFSAAVKALGTQWGTTEITTEVQPKRALVASNRTSYILGANEYISQKMKKPEHDVGILVMCGGTGTGKTRFFSGMEKVIIVSRNVTTLENYAQYGFSQFVFSDRKDNYADIESSKYGANKMTVTYKSFRALLKTVNIQGYTIVFDEAHQLNESYKDVEAETRYCAESLQRISKTNMVWLASANTVRFNPIEPKHIYTFQKPSVKRSVNISYEAKISHLISRIKLRISQGKKVLLLNNRKEEKAINQRIKEEFAGLRIFFFDATKHGKIDLKQLDYDIVITTTALVTGKDVENHNLAVICFVCDHKMPSSVLIQILGRARRWESASYDILLTRKENRQPRKNAESIISAALKIAECVIECAESEASFHRENKDRFVKIDEGGALVPDWFAINQRTQEELSQNIINHSELLSDFFAGHGYEVVLSNLEDEGEEKPPKVEEKEGEKLCNVYDGELSAIAEGNEIEEPHTNAINRYYALGRLGIPHSEAIAICEIYKSPTKWKHFCNILICEASFGDGVTFDNAFLKIEQVVGNFATVEELEKKLMELRFTQREKKLRLVDGCKSKKGRGLLSVLRCYFVEVAKRSSGGKTRLYMFSRSEFLRDGGWDFRDIKACLKYIDYEVFEG